MTTRVPYMSTMLCGTTSTPDSLNWNITRTVLVLSDQPRGNCRNCAAPPGSGDRCDYCGTFYP